MLEVGGAPPTAAPTGRWLGTWAAAPYPIGLAGILVTVGMLFAAFGAALVVRSGGADWVPVTLPPIVWANTVVLLLSSAAVELARRAAQADAPAAVARWLLVAAGLGGLFLGGQVGAWRLLAAQNVFLSTQTHAAFFYMLSAIHGAHVLGGVGALGWTLMRARRGAYTRTQHRGLAHTAIYWHFVGGVWLYLLFLLSTF
jgi:cytochrome c oxidase subunit 3